MKINKFYIPALLSPLMMVGCADWDDWSYNVEKPQTIAQYEYLNDYAPMKENLDRSAHPNFKVGAALSVDEFNGKGSLFRLASRNFDEIVAGNAMKMASCVNDQGEMDFSKVSSFVQASEDANLSIYGHTLAWHEQQPVKWLNKLIADKELDIDPNQKIEREVKTQSFEGLTKFPFFVMGYEPEIINGILTSYNPDGWHQYFVIDGLSGLEEGQTYKVSAMIRASKEHTINVQFGNWGNLAEAKMKIGTEWKECSVEFQCPPVTNGFSVFQPGSFDGTIEIQWVKVVKLETPSVEFFVDQLTNGAMETGKPMDNFVVREAGKGDVPGNPISGGPEGKNCIKITSIANPANSWDTQFFIYTPDKTWAGGEEYKISFWYKASEEAGSETQCHGEPGGYKHWSMLPGNPTFTTEWQHYEKKGTIPAEGNGMKSIAFNLNVNKNQVDYYFADIHWYTIEKGNKIPLTPEEKKDTLTWAMNKWVAGMMQATEGKVKAWDLINEAISGGGNVNGFYDLQSAKYVSEAEAEKKFYWQDYFGAEEYGAIVEKAARDAYAAIEGTNPSDLKLFINDYNLESDWDDNKKLKSLIYWIGVWEKKGQELGYNTKIDGIGSQMHISYYENPQTQESKKNAIVNMLKIMSESGKLVRISELDMGYVDADGKTLTVKDLKEMPLEERIAKEKAMGELYKWIIQKYFEIVPAAQQYGITQWCLTDAPDNSGWRGGEPVGLWTTDYERKPAYAGFAEGLAGK